MGNIINYTIQSYKDCVINFGYPITDHKSYIACGSINCNNVPKLYLSVVTIDFVELLKMILPLLKDRETPFLLIKNDKAHYMLNAGQYGEDEIGKVMIICPKSLQDGILLANQINLLTKEYRGPLCPSAIRIGKVLYIEPLLKGKSLQPFIDKGFKKMSKRRTILGKYYIPIAIIKTSFKGTVYKAVSLTGLSFKTCLVKEGKPQALDDHLGRSILDRLLWQKEVITNLHNQVATPAYYDFFEENEHTYLVTQFIEGVTLFETVSQIYQTRNWNGINKVQQDILLKLFLNAVEIVESIHNQGYVQRDISDSNFLVMSNGSLCIIDFELSYNMITNTPAYPFPLGTVGYAPPEQLELADPDYKEDIYALGALFCFIVTGIPPIHFISKDRQKLFRDLKGITRNNHITKIIIRCLSRHRSERPSLASIREGINNFIEVTTKH
jgi:tRNA A-37 threonylcarbamoyl transferase component Bud32